MTWMNLVSELLLLHKTQGINNSFFCMEHILKHGERDRSKYLLHHPSSLTSICSIKVLRLI
jgi:hypothetical protein